MSVCDGPTLRGPNKGQPARGTEAGYWRHYKAGEPPCDPCHEARKAAKRSWAQSNAAAISEAGQRWYAQNREHRIAMSREWRRANPDRYREQKRSYRERNRDRAAEWSRRWWLANREQHAEAVKRWSRNNPEARKAAKLRRRARLASVLTIPYTVEQLTARLSMFAGCWMCGNEADTVDHVKPLAAGGPDTLANLRPACHTCNASKGARWPLEAAA